MVRAAFSESQRRAEYCPAYRCAPMLVGRVTPVRADLRIPRACRGLRALPLRADLRIPFGARGTAKAFKIAGDTPAATVAR
jgi:hypothetical protein